MEEQDDAKSSEYLLVTGPLDSASSDVCSEPDKISDDIRNMSINVPGFNPDQYHSFEDVRSAIRQQGVETCNLIFAIDFTISNATSGSKTFGGKSLHDMSGVNPYQKVITAIGETIDPMRGENETIHAFGFGDNEVKDKRVFALSQYHILIIVADGQVSEESSSIRAIIEASKFALSIVVIGVGDGPWGVMEEWDDLESFNDTVTGSGSSTRRFDNFQFVNFHKITNEAKNPDVALALAALMEIPDQYKFIKENILLNV